MTYKMTHVTFYLETSFLMLRIEHTSKNSLPRNVTPNASENMLTILNVLMLSCRLFKQVLYCPYRLYLLLSYWLLEYSHSDPIPQHFCLQFKFFLAQI